MRQFDAYQNPSPEARLIAPYLVVLSSHHLHGLSEVIVAPAVNDATRVIGDLEIAVEVQDAPLTLVVSELFSLSATALRRRAGSLVEHEDAIRRALDRLFTGF
ncbi:CcdB family protein [Caulobacter sp. 1776]|uniref:CcdB family protein n=1 Tax=Caulobacter sp. 1776 TaxID=3156420 RepID=UPI0033949411